MSHLTQIAIWLLFTVNTAQANVLPDEFSKLRLGMPWNEVLLILPTARDSSAEFDGKDGTPVKDQPRSILGYWTDNSKKTQIMVMFEKGILNGIILSYFDRGYDFAEALCSELDRNFGKQKSVTNNKERTHQEIRWIKDDILYDFYLPDTEKPRAKIISLRVISKERLLELEKIKAQHQE